MCYEESSVSMLVNVHEIPYFGEQTELTPRVQVMRLEEN